MTGLRLADVLPGAAHVLGVPGLAAAVRHVVVLLVDGLGARQLEAHAELTPTLAGMAELGPASAPFPATTCVSLTSLGTGLQPGAHGIVGTSFRLDDGSVLAPLSWGANPNPIATQPEPTILERAAAAGVLVVSAAPAQHRMSGLTRAALRGGEYADAQSAADRVTIARGSIDRARAEGRASLVYVYWPELDKAGHVHGVGSGAYRAELVGTDALVGSLAELTGPDVLLMVTADHGLVDVPDERRFDLESRPILRHGVETILGEPRVRHVYAEPGRADEVLEAWRDTLADRADVRARDEVAALMGPLEEWYADRVGDVVAIARDDWSLVSERVDRIVSSLRGQHGGVSDDEVLVPLRMAQGR
jgi:hypothetical protein